MADNIDSKADIFQVVRRGSPDEYKQYINNADIDIINEQGQTLLHEAVVRRKRDIAVDLMDRGINTNAQDKKGQTVLHYICFYPDKEIADIIIGKGGRLDIKDSYGNNPLWYAVINAKGNYDLVELLIKSGADPQCQNKAGRSAYDMALQLKDETLINLLKK